MKTILKEYIREKIGKREKAIDSVWINVLGVISALELTDKFVLKFLEDVKKDKIFKSLNFFNGGNWIEEVENPKYVKFLQSLFETCPKGLGTPNAACGEGELMLILSSPKLKKPTKNDIQIDGGKTINLKNDTPRIFAEIDGKRLNKIMIAEANKLGLKPISGKSGESIQLVTRNYINDYWNPQFSNMDKIQVLEFLSYFLSKLFPEDKITKNETNEIVSKCLNGNQLVWEAWIEELIIFIFKYGKDKSENLLSMKVDGGVKVIPSNLIEFSELVRNKTIKFESGYFRMFQNGKVGIYIKF
jgi:hypothetical protein